MSGDTLPDNGLVDGGDDLDAFMGADLRFHSLLLQACGNVLLDDTQKNVASALRQPRG
jgi:DNA-binding FadR family transcriptional regulator